MPKRDSRRNAGGGSVEDHFGVHEQGQLEAVPAPDAFQTEPLCYSFFFFSPPAKRLLRSSCIFSYFPNCSVVRISFIFVVCSAMIGCNFSRICSRGTSPPLKRSRIFLEESSSTALTFGFCSSVRVKAVVICSICCSTVGR